jgi:hypothetical protein
MFPKHEMMDIQTHRHNLHEMSLVKKLEYFSLMNPR